MNIKILFFLCASVFCLNSSSEEWQVVGQEDRLGTLRSLDKSSVKYISTDSIEYFIIYSNETPKYASARKKRIVVVNCESKKRDERVTRSEEIRLREVIPASLNYIEIGMACDIAKSLKSKDFFSTAQESPNSTSGISQESSRLQAGSDIGPLDQNDPKEKSKIFENKANGDEILSKTRKAAESGHVDSQVSLGIMYVLGRGVEKDYQQGLLWLRKAAAQGAAQAQAFLGTLFEVGMGVPQNDREAVEWYTKAAEQGVANAQLRLGAMYYRGAGVPRNMQITYFWWLLAAAAGNQDAIKGRDALESRITAEQRVAAQSAASNWKPQLVSKNRESSDNRASPPSSGMGGQPFPSPADMTGSGVRVARGFIVTNHHVVDGCSRLGVNGLAAQVGGSDPRNDLALLKVSLAGTSANLRVQRTAVGEPVAVAGYPLRGLLSGFNMTTGNLSSLSGLGGDTRLVQISAPVQPGNSGGPLLDLAGNLMGVVVSKLDAVKTAKITGDIPQNVNFAINANVLRSFLDANSVDYEASRSDKAIAWTAIAEKAKGFTVLVECWK